MCRPCPAGYVQWLPNQSQCVECDAIALACHHFRDRLQLHPGFFLDASAWDHPDVAPRPVPCPFEDSCAGGDAPGELCRAGSNGTLCGTCDLHYYRDRHFCKPCPHGNTEFATTLFLGFLIIFAVVGVLLCYLRSSAIGAIATSSAHQQSAKFLRDDDVVQHDGTSKDAMANCKAETGIAGGTAVSLKCGTSQLTGSSGHDAHERFVSYSSWPASAQRFVSYSEPAQRTAIRGIRQIPAPSHEAVACTPAFAQGAAEKEEAPVGMPEQVSHRQARHHALCAPALGARRAVGRAAALVSAALRRCAEPATRTVRRLVPASWPRLASTIVKILISYIQMLYVFTRLQSVHWPKAFLDFIHHINISALVGVEAWIERLLLPYDCVFHNVSAFQFLVLTLLAPVAISACVFAMTLLVVCTFPRQKVPAGFDWAAALAPGLWNVHVWVLLLLYPSLSREALNLFQCTELDGRFYLDSDTRILCFSRDWNVFAFLAAAIGILGYALGLPAAAFLLTQRHQRTTDPRARARLGRRISLLLSSYEERCWWFESADLVRKFLLTGVILNVDPGSRVQIWFGLLVSVAASILLLRVDPCAPRRSFTERAPRTACAHTASTLCSVRAPRLVCAERPPPAHLYGLRACADQDRLCGWLQAAATLQIMFNYMTSIVFFIPRGAPPDANPLLASYLGTLLVIANSIVFVLLAAALAVGARSAIMAPLCQWQLTRHPLVAQRPVGKYHCLLGRANDRTLEHASRTILQWSEVVRRSFSRCAASLTAISMGRTRRRPSSSRCPACARACRRSSTSTTYIPSMTSSSSWTAPTL